ncbi:MAG TPA: transglutaminase-like cysteine peptidase [Stellaceae bacterium]|nr:transglutaminase-like cysteine peptidase [Stellaceae bacterium]
MRSGLCLAAVALSAIGFAVFDPASAGTRMETAAPAVPPAGFLGFCLKHLPDCTGRTSGGGVELTPERLRLLQSVQAQVNAAIAPCEDPTHSWDYPTDGTGDCNRYALEKRRELIERGWPRGSALLATAITETGEDHLVVVARTDRGDLVLDNRVAPVVDWAELPYRWISIQSDRSPVQWLSVVSSPAAAGGTSTPRRAPSAAR